MSDISKSRRVFDTAFKMSVVAEFLQGTHSKRSLCNKYSIPSTSTLRSWIRIFAPDNELHDTPMPKKPQSENEEILALPSSSSRKRIVLEA